MKQMIIVAAVVFLVGTLLNVMFLNKHVWNKVGNYEDFED